MDKKFLPFFPLKLVAFPGEQVNLHIFEPRYKQLINECIAQGSTFGIPVFHNSILDYGAEMAVLEVVKTYNAGEMDIITKCIGAFRMINFQEKVEGKLYAGGEVTTLVNVQDGQESQWSQIEASV